MDKCGGLPCRPQIPSHSFGENGLACASEAVNADEDCALQGSRCLQVADDISEMRHHIPRSRLAAGRSAAAAPDPTKTVSGSSVARLKPAAVSCSGLACPWLLDHRRTTSPHHR